MAKIKRSISLSKKDWELLSKTAKNNGLQLSAYLSYLINTIEIRNNADVESTWKETEEKNNLKRDLHLTLSKDEARILKQKSDGLGLSPQSYLRKIIRCKKFVNISVSAIDLSDMCSVMGETRDAILHFIALAVRSGTPIARDDIAEIGLQLKELVRIVRGIYKVAMDSRYKILNKIYDEIMTQIEE